MTLPSRIGDRQGAPAPSMSGLDLAKVVSVDEAYEWSQTA